MTSAQVKAKMIPLATQGIRRLLALRRDPAARSELRCWIRHLRAARGIAV